MSPSTINEPLMILSTPRSKSYKIFFFFSLLITTVVSLTIFLTSKRNTIILPSSSSLCLTSPSPISCKRVVTEALADSHVKILQNIIARSLDVVDSAVLMAGGEDTLPPAVVDCVHLMDLSRHHLLCSASAINTSDYVDAQTWLSAVLTNHGTCLDGLRYSDDPDIPPELEAQVKDLMVIGSAALAVLSSSISTGEDDYISRPTVGFPSWVTFHDRKLLESAPKANLVVAQDGSGNFKTVQAAIDAAPSNSGTRYVIYVKIGIYKENVIVGKTKKNIMIVGDGMDKTIITGSRNVVDGGTTFNSGTLIAEGDNFILQDLTVQNTAGAMKHQAVALRTSADCSIVNRCLIDAYQDTLYTHILRQFFRDSTITGTVDFIFGNAAVVFQNCNIVARKPMNKQQNTITAQGRTDPNQNTGTSVHNCQVIPSSDLIPVKGSIPSYLGRPWKEYSRTVFLQSYIDNHIVAKGWLEWDGNFALRTLLYGEYSNRGPGAGTAGRVKWLGYKVMTKATEAMPFTVGQLIQGGQWLGTTGVPFTEGLF